jgi:hypothetical protein
MATPALPTNVQTPNQLDQLFAFYAHFHVGIDGYVYGRMQKMEEYMKKHPKAKRILYVPYPSLVPRDRTGSMDFRFVVNIALFEIVPKNNAYSAEQDAVSNGQAVLLQLLTRLRQHASDKGWSFTMNDINDMSPVIDYGLAHVAGYQANIYVGDYYSPVPPHAVWSDIPAPI